MPGLAVASGSLDAPARASLLERLLRDDYRAHVLVDVPGRLVVGGAVPDWYPLRVERAGGAVCALEGAVYSSTPDELGAALREVAAAFARDPADARSRAEAWALRVDGDFVLCIADERGANALVVNDRLGRLPLYFARASGGCAIAREIKFVRAFAGAGSVDRQALAQLLLFSFPLGARTLHADIARLPEASSVAIGPDGAMDVRRYYEWNFEALADRDQGTDAADRLASDFVERCGQLGRWAHGSPLVVGMSGGLDSRSAAAGLSRAGFPYASVTFESGRRGATAETKTARAIADALGAPWRLYELAKPRWDAIERLAARCDGTTNVGMAFMEEFFSRFRADFGANAMQVTGDGGDRALPELADLVPPKSRDAFVAQRIAGALWPVETVARLARLKVPEIVAGVHAHVDAYPESDPAMWTVRHMIADWGWGRIFSGEDRSRSYAWTMTPFYCQSFFERAMRVPQRAKRDYALYARFLRRLDPRVAGLKKSNWGYAPTSPLVRMRGIAATLQANLPAAAKKVIGALGAPRKREMNAARTSDPEFLSAIADRRNDVFDAGALADVARAGCGKTQYHMLVTALLYADRVWRA
jgi:asparagine synthase (glutamine-hydrolysing)